MNGAILLNSDMGIPAPNLLMTLAQAVRFKNSEYGQYLRDLIERGY